eukprot:scaffold22521_cov49-Phaeocystis_antarctica.AAC.1
MRVEPFAAACLLEGRGGGAFRRVCVCAASRRRNLFCAAAGVLVGMLESVDLDLPTALTTIDR